MTKSEKKLIRDFFACAALLLDAKIVRSDKLLGDIGEWLCVKKYNLVLAISGRNPGFDGYIGRKKVQVKVHNSSKGTNLAVGNPEKYDKLIVIIGPRSRLRHDNSVHSFHVYHFRSDEVKTLMARASGYYCAKAILNTRKHESIAI